MTDETPGLPEDNEDFMQHLAALAKTGEVLAKDLPKLANAVRRNRIAIWLLGVALAASGYAIYAEYKTNERQTRTNNIVLCPLYGAFVGSFTPAQRAAQLPDNLAYYDKAIADIRKAYADLGCPASPGR